MPNISHLVCSILITHISYAYFSHAYLPTSQGVLCLFLTHLIICITSWCCISHLGCSYIYPRLFCVCWGSMLISHSSYMYILHPGHLGCSYIPYCSVYARVPCLYFHISRVPYYAQVIVTQAHTAFKMFFWEQ